MASTICIFLSLFFLLHWVFVAALGLSLVVASRDYSSLWCTGFSLWWLLWLQSSGCRASGLQQLQLTGSRAQLSHCGSQA